MNNNYIRLKFPNNKFPKGNYIEFIKDGVLLHRSSCFNARDPQQSERAFRIGLQYIDVDDINDFLLSAKSHGLIHDDFDPYN